VISGFSLSGSAGIRAVTEKGWLSATVVSSWQAEKARRARRARNNDLRGDWIMVFMVLR
jgi:hypothetical protein